MFTDDEHNFLITAVDEAVKRGGLNMAGMGLSVAMKLQKSAQENGENTPAPIDAKPKGKAQAEKRANGK